MAHNLWIYLAAADRRGLRRFRIWEGEDPARLPRRPIPRAGSPASQMPPVPMTRFTPAAAPISTTGPGRQDNQDAAHPDRELPAQPTARGACGPDADPKLQPGCPAAARTCRAGRSASWSTAQARPSAPTIAASRAGVSRPGLWRRTRLVIRQLDGSRFRLTAETSVRR